MLRKIATASLILIVASVLTACSDKAPEQNAEPAAQVQDAAPVTKDQAKANANAMLSGGADAMEDYKRRQAERKERVFNSQGAHDSEQAAEAALKAAGTKPAQNDPEQR